MGWGEKSLEICFFKVELALILHSFLNMWLSCARREYNGDRCPSRKLQWFRSNLKGRTFCVSCGDSVSSLAPLSYGVPQGSVFRPSPFLSLSAPLGSTIRKHGLLFHCYADDSQIYVPLRKNDTVRPLLDCLDDIKAWMSLIFLSFNENKTEVMVFRFWRCSVQSTLRMAPLNLCFYILFYVFVLSLFTRITSALFRMDQNIFICVQQNKSSGWGLLGGHDRQGPGATILPRHRGYTPTLYEKCHGIFNDHRESGPRFNVSSEERWLLTV